MILRDNIKWYYINIKSSKEKLTLGKERYEINDLILHLKEVEKEKRKGRK